MTLATDRETRQMVALNADVVGYSRLMADDFSATTAAMDEYHRLVEEKVSATRYLGQWEKSVELLDRAMRLTQVINPWYPTIQACSLYIGHRLEGAASTAEAVLEHQPHNLEALLVLAASQHEMGLDRRARATAELVKERYPAMDVDAWLAAHPYQSPLLVERWRKTLTELGLIKSGGDAAQE
ncbi:MAG TPA: hypothetical protein VM470_10090 [Acidimicrobiia bacterium]|nr:hypothetical protein [Acidimicrobiia bacterium]